MIDFDPTNLIMTLMGIIATLFALFIATIVLVFQTLPEYKEKILRNIKRNKEMLIKDTDALKKEFNDRDENNITAYDYLKRKFVTDYKYHISKNIRFFELLSILFIIFEFCNGILLFFIKNIEHKYLCQYSLYSYLFFVFLVAYIIYISYFMLYYMVSLGADVSLDLTDPSVRSRFYGKYGKKKGILSTYYEKMFSNKYRKEFFYLTLIVLSFFFMILTCRLYRNFFIL